MSTDRVITVGLADLKSHLGRHIEQLQYGIYDQLNITRSGELAAVAVSAKTWQAMTEAIAGLGAQ